MEDNTNLFDLGGRVALVTGAGSGIGKSIAASLVHQGATAVLADIDLEASQLACEEIDPAGHRARPAQCDVRSRAEVEGLVAGIVNDLGAVDILVNNVGGGSSAGPSEHLSLDNWNATLELTLTSAFLCCQAAGRPMIERGHGTIVNIASVYGLVGHNPLFYDRLPDGSRRESLAYAAAKGGIVSMTRALAVYWAPFNVRVNAVAPGMVQTERLERVISKETWDRLSERTPLGRPASPEDIAGAVVYLASSAAAFVTGQVLVVDGGWTIW